jgi:hypothetical protein
MSEHILRILLSELIKVRIVCRNPDCGVVTELPLDFAKIERIHKCPFCPQILLNAETREGAFAALARGLIEAMAVEGAGIEFLLPGSAGEPEPAPEPKRRKR